MPFDTKDIRELLALAELKSIDTAARRIRFVISSESVDRDNEVVTVDAIAKAIPGFGRNPVALAGHLHRTQNGEPPVVGHWDINSFKALKTRSEMDLVFADTDLAEKYWLLYSNKHMRAVSIGFRVLDFQEEVVSGKRIRIITKIELYEISLVAVPANPDALSKEQKDAADTALAEKITAAVNSKIAEVVPAIVKEYFDTRFAEVEDNLEDIKSILSLDSGQYAERLLGVDSDHINHAKKEDTAEQDVILNALAKALQKHQQHKEQ